MSMWGKLGWVEFLKMAQQKEEASRCGADASNTGFVECNG